MCPLRVILIFLSATLAGFFLLRNLKSRPEFDVDDKDESPKEQVPLFTKVGSVISTGFWTCVDMASGKYLWRSLMAPAAAAAAEEEEKKKF